MASSESQVGRIISEVLGISIDEVQPDTRIRALPKVESIRILNIILKVEKLYGIEIPDDATFRLETVGEFVSLVDELRASNLKMVA